MTLTKLLPLALCALLMQGCATQAPAPSGTAPDFGDSSRFGDRPPIPTPDDLHRLTPQQQAAFLAYFHHPSRANVNAHVRLYQYLENLVGHFQYEPDTLTATEVIANEAGNCLSLAIVATALAQLAGVHIGYQLMDDRPVFEYHGHVVLKGVHVSSLIYDPAWNKAADATAAGPVSPVMRVDYFPEIRGRFLANISREEYLALYYSNIASDAITRNDYATAYWYLIEAVKHAPTHGGSLNMLAVINRRTGDTETAERIYQYGIAHADDKLSLLKNYHTLLVANGRHEEAARVQDQLDTMQDPSPLHWLRLARASQDNGDLRGAIRSYRRVLELAPYMHEVHLGLAQTYHAAGDLRRAEQELVTAANLANSVSTRNLYKAKLLSLRNGL